MLVMSKPLMMLCITVGGLLGSYLPVVLFHVDGFSIISILGGMFGGFAGLWAAMKINGYAG